MRRLSHCTLYSGRRQDDGVAYASQLLSGLPIAMAPESKLDPKIRSARALMKANPYNVLFGSGYHLNTLRQSSPFRALVKEHCVYYNQETPRLKYSFIETHILQVVRDNGGKFYRWCDKSQNWVVEDKGSILNTVAQALRSEFKLVQRFQNSTAHDKDGYSDAEETETQDEDEENSDEEGHKNSVVHVFPNVIDSPATRPLTLPLSTNNESSRDDSQLDSQSRTQLPSSCEEETAGTAAKAKPGEHGATVPHPDFQGIAAEGVGDYGYGNEDDAKFDILLSTNISAALGSREDRIRVIKYVLTKDAEESKPLTLPRTDLHNALRLLDAGISTLERNLGLKSSADD